MNVMGCEWVFKTKLKSDGILQKYKARLVANGFQQTPGLDCFDTFSPVIKPNSIRIMLSLVVHNNWSIKQIDINNVFLNGELIETVFMVQPQGFGDQVQPKHVYKLHKALYRLKQAPRAWFDKLKTALIEWGFQS